MAEIQPTERELEALKVLWERREATVRDLCDALNERGAELAYTTVLSLLQVMEQKGLVTIAATARRMCTLRRLIAAARSARWRAGFSNGCSTARWTSTSCTRSNREP